MNCYKIKWFQHYSQQMVTIKALNVLRFVSSESDNASWEIPHVTLKDEGYYECVAVSSAGTGRARTFLDVSGNHGVITGLKIQLVW